MNLLELERCREQNHTTPRECRASCVSAKGILNAFESDWLPLLPMNLSAFLFTGMLTKERNQGPKELDIIHGESQTVLHSAALQHLAPASRRRPGGFSLPSSAVIRACLWPV
jgi:hypothetical protein